MSGYTVAKVLNRLDKKPKIGMMTGWSEEIDTEDGNRLNADFIIKKPFRFPVLAKYVNNAFCADSR